MEPPIEQRGDRRRSVDRLEADTPRAAELDDLPCAVGGTRASGIDSQRAISAGQFDTTPTRAVASVGNGEINRNFLPSAATAY
jgi:hypothetical protein